MFVSSNYKLGFITLVAAVGYTYGIHAVGSNEAAISVSFTEERIEGLISQLSDPEAKMQWWNFHAKLGEPLTGLLTLKPLKYQPGS